MNRRFRHVFMAEAGDGATGGGSAGAGAAGSADAGAGAAGAGGGNGAAGGAGAGAGSVLAAGAAAPGGGSAAAGAAGGAADPNAWLPEKHRVFGQDGKTLDLEASARKVAEAYGHAEKRIGSGDLPPKTADEYKVTVPESLAERIKADDLAKSEDFKGFTTKMHSLGLTQKQLDGVTAELLERSVKLQDGAPQLQADECAQELRGAWKTEAEFNSNIGNAFLAFKAFAAPGDAERLDEIGNNPLVVRLLANIGREMQEDTQIADGTPAAQDWQGEVDAIRANPAYTDASSPQHKALVEKMNGLYARRHGSKPHKLGGGVTFSTAR